MSVIRTYFVLVLVASFGLVSLTFSSSASALSGQDWMQAAYDQSRQHKNQQAEAKLIITDKSGRERTRYFSFLYKIFDERTKSLIKFYQPPAVKGTGLLSETQDRSDDTDQWIYLPALKSVKQLSSDDKNKSFMGSDFTNADIAGRKVTQDKHRLLNDKGNVVVIISRPKKANDFYSRIETHILKNIKVPKQIIFYDRNGQKLKTLKNQVVKKVSGMYTVMQAEMTNHRSGGKSQIVKSNFDVSRAIDENAVGFKGLQR